MNNSTSKSGLSWPIVIILLFLLFPVGAIMLIIKWNSDLDEHSKIPTVLLSVGGALTVLSAFLFALQALSCETDPFGNWISYLQSYFILLAIGTWILLVGIVVYLKNRSRREWIRLVRDQDIRNLSDLAMLLHTSEEKAAGRIEDLIERGYLEDMCIDYGEMRIFKAGDPDADIFWCADCGASNIIRDSRTHLCRLCGGPAVMRHKQDRIEESLSLSLAEKIKSDKKLIFRYMANVLWVTSAFLSGSTAYFTFPVCILLFLLGTVLELAARPRENPVILYSGIGSLTMGLYMTLILAGMNLDKPLENQAGLAFSNWYSCLMLFAIEFLIWLVLARRAEIMRVRPLIAEAVQELSMDKENTEQAVEGGQ